MSAQLAQPRGAQSPVDANAHPVALRLEQVRKSFGTRPVLRGVTYSLEAGRALVIFGPNGAGKTTLLRLLATLTRPSGGSAEVAGFDLVDEAQDVRRHTGYVGHQPHAYEDLTARENLLFFARMYGLPDGASRAAALLEQVGLSAKAGERVGAFSRGQAQRLALARGVIHDPAVLLLDEPDTGLDQEALALLERLVEDRRARGQTTILTTHHLAWGLRLADEALALVAGRVAHTGPTERLDVETVARLAAGQAGTGGAA